MSSKYITLNSVIFWKHIIYNNIVLFLVPITSAFSVYNYLFNLKESLVM